MDYQGTFRTMFRSLRALILDFCEDNGIHINESREGEYYRLDFYGYDDAGDRLYEFITAHTITAV